MSRVRTRGPGSVTDLFTVTFKNPISGQVTSTVDYNLETVHHLDTMVDQITPFYHKIRKEGGVLPVNPMTKTNFNLAYEPGLCHYTDLATTDRDGAWARFHALNHAYIPIPPEYLSQDYSDDVAQLLKQAVAYAKSADFDILTFLLEFSKTKELFAGAAARFRKALEDLARAARRKSKRNGRSAWDVFNDLWLEGRYGWRIAYFDAMGALDLLNDKLTTISRGFATSEYGHEYVHNEQHDYTAFTEFASLKFIINHKLRAGAFFTVDSEHPNIGFNPIITTWELIPYSFVIDWFIDVGTSLEAISPRYGYELQHLWSSRELSITVEDVQGYAAWNSGWSGSYVPPQIEYDFVTYQRVVETSPAILPTFDLNFNVFKLIDAIALLSNSRKRVRGILSI